jgi:hypothetical protein
VPLLILALILLLPLAFVVLLPLSLVQRYRAGTARRMGRSWVATLNIAALGLSAVVFIIAAAITNVWAPETLRYSIAGLAAGAVLGLLGLKLTRWEPAARGLHYTPPRLLVLLITLAVASRVVYGFVRALRTWEDAGLHGPWVATVGAAGSLGVGGLVLGYYLTYWAGLARRVKGRGRLKVTRVT